MSRQIKIKNNKYQALKDEEYIENDGSKDNIHDSNLNQRHEIQKEIKLEIRVTKLESLHMWKNRWVGDKIPLLQLKQKDKRHIWRTHWFWVIEDH